MRDVHHRPDFHSAPRTASRTSTRTEKRGLSESLVFRTEPT